MDVCPVKKNLGKVLILDVALAEYKNIEHMFSVLFCGAF
jgi:hypothetical protein